MELSTGAVEEEAGADELSAAATTDEEAGELSTATVEEEAASDDDAGAVVDEDAGAEEPESEVSASDSVGVSPLRMQPVLSVKALGQVTCL